jgi:hypothetical protein
MVKLAVSGQLVDVRPPGGAEEVLLWEASELDRALALELVRRLTTADAPAELTVHDFETLLIHLRALVLGNEISADAVCGCGESVDVSFGVSEFLKSRAPRKPRGVARADEAGWHSLDGTVFRLPTVGDQIMVAAEPDPAAALTARCVRSTRVPARAERAMAALAPGLSGPVQGVCPHCAATITLLFDVPSFVLSELRVQASLIFEHVHLLAGHYHWTEDKILELPRWRRQHYVDMVVAERRGIA